MFDPRYATGLTGQVVRRLDAFNQRHPWSHNDHFHGWILRRLPPARRAALDVGCGRGALVEALAGRFERVDGIDRDGEMARLAGERLAANRRVRIRQTPFDQVTGTYDLITMIAVLHHLELEDALAQARSLLAPAGRLLVVGLARPVSRLDWAWEVTSAVANPVVGLIRHPRPERGGPHQPPFPVLPPDRGYDETRAVARRVLPGVRARRRLFFRYTLAWTKPDRPRR